MSHSIEFVSYKKRIYVAEVLSMDEITYNLW